MRVVIVIIMIVIIMIVIILIVIILIVIIVINYHSHILTLIMSWFEFGDSGVNIDERKEFD